MNFFKNTDNLSGVDRYMLYRETIRHAASCKNSERDFKGQEAEF